MPARRYHLTPEVQQQLCAFIRAGAYRRVAARAAGIPIEVFEDWMRRGSRRGDSHRTYRDFRDAVEGAEAAARVLAEVNAYQNNPLAWLKFGPGKERADTPGWSGLAKARAGGGAPTGVTLRELRAFWVAIVSVLGPYPELRAQMAEAVAQVEVAGQKDGWLLEELEAEGDEEPTPQAVPEPAGKEPGTLRAESVGGPPGTGG